MYKKIVVAGCRHFFDYNIAQKEIELFIKENVDTKNLIFLSGGCSGADFLGERYAEEKGYTIERYPANWEKYGRAAGPIRNEQMAKDTDYVLCFWDKKSRGTKSMINYAKQYGKPIKIVKI